MPNISELAQLGSTVVTVAIFIWYLSKRDRDWIIEIKENREDLRKHMIYDIEIQRAISKSLDGIANQIDGINKKRK